ncbi:hypothetical protein QYM36_002773, partial [Artemia franciscana]
ALMVINSVLHLIEMVVVVFQMYRNMNPADKFTHPELETIYEALELPEIIFLERRIFEEEINLSEDDIFEAVGRPKSFLKDKREKFPENFEYIVSGDPEQLKAQAAAASADAAISAGANGVESIDVDEIEEIPQNVIQKGLKRKEAEEPPVPAKKAKSAPVELIEL